MPRIVILLISLILSISCAHGNKQTSEQVNQFINLTGPYLAETLSGSYKVEFKQVKDSKVVASAEGVLTLVPTDPNDISPMTGEKPPANEDRNVVPLYGWLIADLDKVQAPIFNVDARRTEPLPHSRDPIYPGVLVHVMDTETQKTKQIVLTVSTVSNLRNGELWMDGAGIGMWLETVTLAGFSGRWQEWGIIRGGRGIFSAQRIEEQ